MKYVVKVRAHKDTPGAVNEGKISIVPENWHIFFSPAATFHANHASS